MPVIIGNPDQINFITGTDSFDRITGGNQIDFISAGGGNDRIFGGMGSDFLDGGAGADHLRGGQGDDRLFGGDGNDRLYGGEGNDVLQGGNGNDRLYLGDGDIASGDDGADTFIWRVIADETISISDFDAQEGDQMLLRGVQDMGWDLTEDSNHTTVTYENGAEIKFYGYTAAEIEANAADFGL